jgi:hypothetical protein
MPVFEIKMPDGKTYEVDAKDMATASAALDHHVSSPSMVEGIGRAVARGVPIVGGALNKVDAATNAALAPVLNPLFDKENQLPEPTFGERYAHSLKDQEGKDKSFAEEHPIADAVAEIGGGIASTGAAAATTTGAQLLGLTGKTLPQMMARGAASGAVIDSADAAVRGRKSVTAGAVGGGRRRGIAAGWAAGQFQSGAADRQHARGNPRSGWRSGAAGRRGDRSRHPEQRSRADAAGNDRRAGARPAGDADGCRRRDHAGAGAKLANTSPEGRAN